MSLTDQLQADMKDAMRSGDAERRDTLRMVIAAVQNAEKEKREPLSDEEMRKKLVVPNAERIFHVANALRGGMLATRRKQLEQSSVETIRSKLDPLEAELVVRAPASRRSRSQKN